MLVAFDIDGTIDADPPVFLSLMQALRAAGSTVVITTGIAGPTVVPQDITDKATYLQALGFGQAYDQLVVLPEPHDENKAAWLKANNADLLVDNDKENAKAAAGVCQILVPWQTRKS